MFVSVPIKERQLGLAVEARVRNLGFNVLSALGDTSPDDVAMFESNVSLIARCHMFVAVLRNYGRDLAAEVGMAYAWRMPSIGVDFGDGKDDVMVRHALGRIVGPDELEEALREFVSYSKSPDSVAEGLTPADGIALGCPFCSPRVDREPVVFENGHCVVLDLRHEVLEGSCIIVPRVHRATPFELSAGEVKGTFELLRRMKARLDSRLTPDGYNVGWNCGPVAGQEVEHAHLHLIPRFHDEPFAGRGIRHWLKQEANRRGASA